MIRISPFVPDDLLRMDIQPLQRAATPGLSLYQLGLANAKGGNAFTARDADSGRILLCAGASDVFPHYATLWAVLAAEKGHKLVSLTRKVRQFIDGLPHARVDCSIHREFEEAIAWAEILGLTFEARLTGAMPDGGDSLIYKRRDR